MFIGGTCLAISGDVGGNAEHVGMGAMPFQQGAVPFEDVQPWDWSLEMNPIGERRDAMPLFCDNDELLREDWHEREKEEQEYSYERRECMHGYPRGECRFCCFNMDNIWVYERFMENACFLVPEPPYPLNSTGYTEMFRKNLQDLGNKSLFEGSRYAMVRSLVLSSIPRGATCPPLFLFDTELSSQIDVFFDRDWNAGIYMDPKGFFRQSMNDLSPATLFHAFSTGLQPDTIIDGHTVCYHILHVLSILINQPMPVRRVRREKKVKVKMEWIPSLLTRMRCQPYLWAFFGLAFCLLCCHFPHYITENMGFRLLVLMDPKANVCLPAESLTLNYANRMAFILHNYVDSHYWNFQ